MELNIGHFLIGEAVFVGLEGAIAQMRSLMDISAWMIIGIGTDLANIDRIRPFGATTEVGFETACSQTSSYREPSAEWMRQERCQTLGRKRGLF